MAEPSRKRPRGDFGNVSLAEVSELWRCLVSKDYKIYTLNDGLSVYELPSHVHWLCTNSSLLFVRQCHRDIFAIVERTHAQQTEHDRHDGIHLTGLPGVGKKSFLNIILSELAIQFQSKQSNFNRIFVMIESDFMFELTGDGARRHLPTDSDTYTLRDIYVQYATSNVPVSALASRMFAVVVSTWNRRAFREWSQQRSIVGVCLPCWYFLELRTLVHSNYLEANVLQRFEVAGGVLRTLLLNRESYEAWRRQTSILLNKITDSNTDFLRIVKENVDDFDESNAAHVLVNVYDDQNQPTLARRYAPPNCKVVAASEYILWTLLDMVARKQSLKSITMLRKWRPYITLLCGSSLMEAFFKALMWNVLAKGGKFVTRQLSVGGSRMGDVELELTRLAPTEETASTTVNSLRPAFHELCTLENGDTLSKWTPSSIGSMCRDCSNQLVAIDGAIRLDDDVHHGRRRIALLRFSVGDNQPINGDELSNCINTLRSCDGFYTCEFRLYHVVTGAAFLEEFGASQEIEGGADAGIAQFVLKGFQEWRCCS